MGRIAIYCRLSNDEDKKRKCTMNLQIRKVKLLDYIMEKNIKNIIFSIENYN